MVKWSLFDDYKVLKELEKIQIWSTIGVKTYSTAELRKIINFKRETELSRQTIYEKLCGLYERGLINLFRKNDVGNCKWSITPDGKRAIPGFEVQLSIQIAQQSRDVSVKKTYMEI